MGRVHSATVAPPRGAVIAWIMLIFSLMGGDFWVRQRAIDVDAKRVAVSASSASLAKVRYCLNTRETAGLALGAWREGGEMSRVVVAENAARHLVVSITDRVQDRLIQFSTRDRRPLRASERLIFERCRALPPD